MRFKSLMKSVYHGGTVALLASLIAVNIFVYRTLWRTYSSQGVYIDSSTKMVDVLKDAEGNGLEDKIQNVIAEGVDFSREGVSDEFRDMVFGFLDGKGIDPKGKNLDLEEKILYSQMFSSSLRYNNKANLIVHAVEGDKIYFDKAIESISEFSKISNMSCEDIVEYRTVVCGQFARVFAAALHSINEFSANPSEIHVATLRFVPDYDISIGGELGKVLPVFNAIVFAEYRKSVSHVINLVATDDRFYLIDPQDDVVRMPSGTPVIFSSERLEVYNGYVGKLKKD